MKKHFNNSNFTVSYKYFIAKAEDVSLSAVET